MYKHRQSLAMPSPAFHDLYDNTSITVPGASLTGREIFELYSRGERLPLCEATPSYDSSKHPVYYPSSIGEAIQLAGDELSKFQPVSPQVPSTNVEQVSSGSEQVPASQTD